MLCIFYHNLKKELQAISGECLKCLDGEAQSNQEGDLFHFKQTDFLSRLVDYYSELLLIKCLMQHPLNIK